MKNALVLIFLSQILFGCVVTPKPKETAKEPEVIWPPRPSASQNGRATGKPVVVYYEIGGWTRCATPSISYEHNLEHKADMKPLRDVTMPMWGRPFEFHAFYYNEPMLDGYSEYYIVTDAYALNSAPQAKCFELIFEKPDSEKMCDAKEITHSLKKWLQPNRVTFKDSLKIIKAAQQLPMTLTGCFEGKNLNIVLSLKQTVTK